MDYTAKGNFLGNEKLVGQLARLARNARFSGKNISSSYIFAGQAYSGKKETALWYASALLCESSRSGEPCGLCQSCKQVASGAHPDLYWLKRAEDKKNVAVDDVRDLLRRLSRGSFMGGQQVAVIEDAECLNESSANSLLKILEEPGAGTVIILLVEEPEKILKTIVSRSQLFFLQVSSQADLAKHLETIAGLKRREALEIARLSTGRVRLAMLLAEDRLLYDQRLRSATALIEGFGAPAADQIDKVAELMGNLTGQEAGRKAREILGVWQLVARDWLLVAGGAEELILHLSLAEQIKDKARRIGKSRALQLAHAMRRGLELVEANVSPKLVLENILINANY